MPTRAPVAGTGTVVAPETPGVRPPLLDPAAALEDGAGVGVLRGGVADGDGDGIGGHVSALADTGAEVSGTGRDVAAPEMSDIAISAASPPPAPRRHRHRRRRVGTPFFGPPPPRFTSTTAAPATPAKSNAAVHGADGRSGGGGQNVSAAARSSGCRVAAAAANASVPMAVHSAVCFSHAALRLTTNRPLAMGTPGRNANRTVYEFTLCRLGYPGLKELARRQAHGVDCTPCANR